MALVLLKTVVSCQGDTLLWNINH